MSLNENVNGKRKTLVETLSCPVCDKLPVAPVYGCQNGHIICESCKNNVRHCAICRAERFNVRCLVVEDLLASRLLPCEHQHLGCSQPLMNGEEYTGHVRNCPFRPIECECKDGISDCRSQLVPYNNYVNHLKDFHGATRSNSQSCFISCESQSPKTKTKESSAHPEIRSPLFYIRLKLRYKYRREETQFVTSDVFTPSSPRDLPEDVVKSGRCLEFNASSVSDAVPPCVWPQYEEYDDDESYTRWGYDVEIWEASNRIVRVIPSQKSVVSSTPAGLISTNTNLQVQLLNSNQNQPEMSRTALPPPPPPPALSNPNVSVNVNNVANSNSLPRISPLPPSSELERPPSNPRFSQHHPTEFPTDMILPLPRDHPHPHHTQNPRLFQLDFEFNDLQLGRRWENSCIIGNEDDYSPFGDEEYLHGFDLDRIRALLPLPVPLPLALDVHDGNGNGNGNGLESIENPNSVRAPGSEPQLKRARLELENHTTETETTAAGTTRVLSANCDEDRNEDEDGERQAHDFSTRAEEEELQRDSILTGTGISESKSTSGSNDTANDKNDDHH